jgi:alpha/beta superfamily hydrolase
MGLSNFISENGYNSVALDLRVHEDSEGKFCTFGVKEKKDVQKVIDYLIIQENLNHIGVWGQPLGGVIGLQAMEIDKRLEYGIIESTFTDFKTIVNDYFYKNAGFSCSTISNYLANRAGHIAGFNAEDDRPIKYC